MRLKQLVSETKAFAKLKTTKIGAKSKTDLALIFAHSVSSILNRVSKKTKQDAQNEVEDCEHNY